MLDFKDAHTIVVFIYHKKLQTIPNVLVAFKTRFQHRVLFEYRLAAYCFLKDVILMVKYRQYVFQVRLRSVTMLIKTLNQVNCKTLEWLRITCMSESVTWKFF